MTAHKSEAWKEAQEALLDLTDEAVLANPESEEAASLGDFYTAFLLYATYHSALITTFNWDNLPQLIGAAGRDFRTRSVKDGLCASMVGVDELTGGNFVNTLYLNAPQYHQTGAVDVTVLLAPTDKAIKHLFELGIDPIQLSKLSDEAFCREHSSRLISLTSGAPIVLAFFSPNAPDEIAIEELSTLKVEGHTIERTIEFAPEYYQAGVGLLSYFGEVLRQKDPNTTAKVRIEQDGTTVRLHIESASGEIETIEKELQKFALVISDQLPPESLFENRAYVMQLENKLAVTKMEVKHAQDMNQLTVGLMNQRVNTLEQQVSALTNQLSNALLQTGQVIQLATQQASSHEHVVTALIAHSQGLFKDLLQEASGNQVLSEAVRSLHNSLLAGINAVDAEDKLERALITINKEKPSFLGRIVTEFKGAAYKAGTGSAITWVTDWIHAH